MTLDAMGNIYVAGSIFGVTKVGLGNGVTVAGPHLEERYAESLLLAKYDPAGNALWARTAASASSMSGFSSIATDPAGNVYVTGYLCRSGDFDLGNGITTKGPWYGLTATDHGKNAVIACYDSSGAAHWAQTVVAAEKDTYFMKVALGPDGAIYVSGYFVDG